MYFVYARQMQKLEKIVKEKINSNHCNIFTQHTYQSVRKLFKAIRVGNNIGDYVSWDNFSTFLKTTSTNSLRSIKSNKYHIFIQI